MVKEKVTVRKKRVSKAKGEESDSSDVDQKETAPKVSPPKNSRYRIASARVATCRAAVCLGHLATEVFSYQHILNLNHSKKICSCLPLPSKQVKQQYFLLVQCCESGSAWIRNFCLDPDPEFIQVPVFVFNKHLINVRSRTNEENIIQNFFCFI